MTKLKIGTLRILFLAALGVSVIAPAHATPAPVPQDELERDSDLIIEADVECVAKFGRPGAPGWYARLHVRKTIKGRAPSNPMIYWFSPPELGIVGTRNECVFAGEHVQLSLIRENNRYVAWATNSIELLDGVPDERRVLPTQFGEVIHAPRPTRLPQSPSCHP